MSTLYYPCAYCGEEIGSAQPQIEHDRMVFHTACYDKMVLAAHRRRNRRVFITNLVVTAILIIGAIAFAVWLAEVLYP